MSIASELTALAANRDAIKAAIQAKSPSTAPGDTLASFPAAIASIPSGGGGGHAVAFTGPIYGSSGTLSVTVDGTPHGVYGSEVFEFQSSAVLSTSDENWEATVHLSDGTSISKSRDSDSLTLPSGKSALVSGWYVECLLEGTPLLLADGTSVPIEAVKRSDELAVWDFGRGCASSAKPLWIRGRGEAGYSFRCVFSDGRELLVTGPHGHRGFDLSRGGFRYLPESVGDMFRTVGGSARLVSCEYREGPVRFFNVITMGHMNLFANGVLTSCRLNNYRPFSPDGMKFSGHETVRRGVSGLGGIPQRYVDGLRLLCQPGDTAELRDYVANLIAREAAAEEAAEAQFGRTDTQAEGVPAPCAKGGD